jgi:hypothetical protein
MTTPNRKGSDGSELAGDAEKQVSYGSQLEGSATLTQAPTASSSGDDENEKKGLHAHPPTREDGTYPIDENPYLSPEDSRRVPTQLHDEISIARIERMISNQANELEMHRTASNMRSNSPRPDEDVFNAPTRTRKTLQLAGSEQLNKVNKFFKRMRRLPRVVRYFFYQIPITAILLVPILMGILLPKDQKANFAIGGPNGGGTLVSSHP